MRLVLRIFLRGSFFTTLALGAYLSAVTLAVVLGLASIQTAFFLSWVDVAITAIVALVVSVVPASRLRVLPVWLVCLGLPLLRVRAGAAFLEVFNFGPGAYPLDVGGYMWVICLSPQGSTVLVGVTCVGLCAAIRPPPA